MIQLAPSLLSADFTRLGEQIEMLEEAGIQVLHLDVMDGNFVPNISFGPLVIKALRPLTKMVFDVHLMIEKPERYIETFAEAGADIITIHQEASLHVHRSIQQIKAAGKKAGISLNPGTNHQVLDYVLEDLDLVLLMSVNPGFGGQTYIESTDRKLREIRNWIDARDLDIRLEVDGGIKATNVHRVLEAGADLIVSGSDVFGALSPIERIREYYQVFASYGR
ncbi:MAG: ribulose-phosphate 3-epimerase [Tissierellia bacterium]|nr:ribulose-phosphate 3-epimerase [Tissierellia bacterium]